MITEYDDNKHGEEFRFRVLCTNVCGKKCRYCLNDFMRPTENAAHISINNFAQAYEAYIRWCKYRNSTALLTISGGEPGKHPNHQALIRAARFSAAKNGVKSNIVVVTNGAALTTDPDSTTPDKYHLHVPIEPDCLLELFLGGIEARNTQSVPLLVQTVVTTRSSYPVLQSLAAWCTMRGTPLKLFENFFEQETGDQMLAWAEALKAEFPTLTLKTRHTGVQVNRGPHCSGCTARCVTLKGVWQYPDGSLATCPQEHARQKKYRGHMGHQDSTAQYMLSTYINTAAREHGIT